MSRFLLLLSLVAVMLVVVSVSLISSASASSSSIGPSQLFSRTVNPDSDSHVNNNINNNKVIEELTSFNQITTLVRDRFRASVVIFYDSADLSSWKVKPAIEEAANLLEGFTRVLTADVRNPNVTMLRAAWGVTTVPWVYGIGPKQFKPREDFVSSPGSLSLLTGIRTPIPRIAHFGEMHAQAIRKLGLSLVADASLVIQNVETPSQLQTLEKELAATATAAVGCNVVLLTDKSTTSLLYRALAANYAKRCNFFEVNTKKLPATVMKTFGATSVPHLTVYHHDSSKQSDEAGEAQKIEKSTYQGPLNILSIDKFLSPLVPQSRSDMQSRLYQEHKSALSRSQETRIPVAHHRLS